jgi:hypothetical protein
VEILMRTDHRIPSQDAWFSFVGFEVLAGLGPCASRVTSAQVNLSAENDGRAGPTLRCRLEVLPEGHAPLAVMHQAPTDDEAVRGAVGDMRAVLERMFRRIDAPHAPETFRRPGLRTRIGGGSHGHPGPDRLPRQR